MKFARKGCRKNDSKGRRSDSNSLNLNGSSVYQCDDIKVKGDKKQSSFHEFFGGTISKKQLYTGAMGGRGVIIPGRAKKLPVVFPIDL